MASLPSEPGQVETHPVHDVRFTLSASLRAFGDTGRATLTGREGAPVVAMIGGISGNRFPCTRADGDPGWWSGLAGAGKAIDPGRHRILGMDFVADEAGARAPTPVDQAAALASAMDAFGVDRLHAIVGASYGGMIGLAFAEAVPERLQTLVVIGADAQPHPSSTASRELQRRVVRLGLDTGRGEEALAIARGLAMLTYRSPSEFAERFEGGIDDPDPLTCSAPGRYLRARGEAYREIMSAQRFLSLSASIDRHRCDPRRIGCPAILIGALTDQLVPPAQMEDLAARLAGPIDLHLLPSLYGHDMFLKDTDALTAILSGRL